MYIKKRSGPKTEPCGTPEITVVDSDDTGPLATTSNQPNWHALFYDSQTQTGAPIPETPLVPTPMYMALVNPFPFIYTATAAAWLVH